MIFSDGCLLFVAMATRYMILQSILFLNHVIQQLLFVYDDKRYLYQSTKIVRNLPQNTYKSKIM